MWAKDTGGQYCAGAQVAFQGKAQHTLNSTHYLLLASFYYTNELEHERVADSSLVCAFLQPVQP